MPTTSRPGAAFAVVEADADADADAVLLPSVVVLVTVPLTASATVASPVLITVDPPAIMVLVTVAVCVAHVQPLPQSPQPPQLWPSSPFHGVPSHQQTLPDALAPPLGPPLAPPPVCMPPMEGGVVHVPVMPGHETVSTPVLPSDEQLDQREQTDEDMEAYEE